MKRLLKNKAVYFICAVLCFVFLLWRYRISTQVKYHACFNYLRLGQTEGDVTSIMGVPDKNINSVLDCRNLAKGLCGKGEDKLSVRVLYYFNPPIMDDHNVVYINLRTMKTVLIYCSNKEINAE